jgi:catechol 2,3-dioxygenase-like lactoylglutathione lyase family enzyme
VRTSLQSLRVNTPEFLVHGLHHVQIAIPPEKETIARQFYSDLLGLVEVPVPGNVAHLGALWFERSTFRVHLGIEADFRPAKKAHPAFLVERLDLLIQRLQRAGVSIVAAPPMAGYNRCHVFDPFGNRIELLEALPQ